MASATDVLDRSILDAGSFFRLIAQNLAFHWSASPMELLMFAAFVFCFGFFAWALQGGFFTGTPDRNVGITVTRILGLVCVFTQGTVLVRSLDGALQWPEIVALALYLAALALSLAAARALRGRRLTLAFSSDTPRELIAHGPYRVIRHPFYTSYLLAWTAGPVATGEVWLLLTVLAMGALYAVAARQEEAKFLNSSLSGAYRAYAASAGMFFPRLSRLLT